MSDWELGGIGVGGVFRGSCWCEVSLMLTCMEIPGLYLRPRDGLAIAFDHLSVAQPTRSADGWEVAVSNPTAYPATVRVWRDCEPERPAPTWFSDQLTHLHIDPGMTLAVRF
jgi:hypothetical protein